MGAISSESSKPVLKQYLNDPNRSVRETCEIALAKIEWDNSLEGRTHHSTPTLEDRCVLCTCFTPSLSCLCRAYTSIDPAPPTSGLLKGKPAPEDLSLSTIESLRAALTDPASPLFERYRTMFALRNIGTDEAVDALASGFSDDSPLFKSVFHHLHPAPPLLQADPSLDTKSLSFSVNFSPHTLSQLS
jgi:deoxyhypusine monooxygenase